MLKKNEKIKKRYNRVSSIYDTMDRMIKKSWRKKLLRNLKGKVLEVGVGTGANFKYYPSNIKLVGVDFSPKMLAIARKKAEKNNYNFDIDLIEADIQQLPFEDNTFDYIVSTCVFCSVVEPVKGLRELKRVLKSDGEIVMLEHMRSDNKVLGKIMDILNPISVNLWGANINRKTLENTTKAGLITSEVTNLMGSIMRKLTLKK